MKRWLLRKFWEKYQDHFILEIKACYTDHDDQETWSPSYIDAYIVGLDTAIEVLKGER